MRIIFCSVRLLKLSLEGKVFVFRNLNSLFQKATGFVVITYLSTGILSAEPVTGSQNISITVLASSSFTLESPSLEVIFDSSAGLLQEQVLKTNYYISNLGAGRDITGSLDHIPPGIKVNAEMAVPLPDFSGDSLPVSTGNVELTTSYNQMLSQIGKIAGKGIITYTVGCDLSLADIEQLQAHTIVVSYVMSVTAA